jgi:hypothetical protein
MTTADNRMRSIATAPRVEEMSGVTADRFAADVASAYRPVIFRGLVADWPAVIAGRGGAAAMASYISRFDSGRPASLFVGAPQIDGRFFYREDLDGFNFERGQIRLPLLLERLVAEAANPNAPAFYAGAATAPEHFPGWASENPLPFATPDAVPRVWIGNASRISTHYDASSNVAAVVAGRRRFVLFPPEQVRNLYIGPLDRTMAGQPTSMVDIEAPDLAKFPRFAEAAATMQVAELEPGDALFVPSLWWHEVRASGPLNVLVNYWWGQEGTTSPVAALAHAILAVRDLPAPQRAAMRAWFDHYVFDDGAQQVADHLPEQARGILGPPSPERDEAVRAYLLRAITR